MKGSSKNTSKKTPVKLSGKKVVDENVSTNPDDSRNVDTETNTSEARDFNNEVNLPSDRVLRSRTRATSAPDISLSNSDDISVTVVEPMVQPFSSLHIKNNTSSAMNSPSNSTTPFSPRPTPVLTTFTSSEKLDFQYGSNSWKRAISIQKENKSSTMLGQ